MDIPLIAGIRNKTNNRNGTITALQATHHQHVYLLLFLIFENKVIR